jgi:uncharacterized membrane protein YdjX (TVP38/TMEM64 family)
MTNTINTNHKRFIILLFIISTVIVCHLLGATNCLSLENLHLYTTYAKVIVKNHYWTTVFSFITILIALVTISIPLGVLVPIVSGFLFGSLPGTLYALIGSTLGATTSFLMARYLLGSFIQEKYHEKLKAFNKELKTYGYLYLLGLHFFPITPFFILNILAALTTISLFTFIWTTVVGIIPAYTIYSYLGNKLTTIHAYKDILSKEMVIAFIALKTLSLVTLVIGRFGRQWYVTR